jgi:hypothetical protein
VQAFLIWGGFTVAVTRWCVWRPQPARIFIGLFFAAMGLGIQGGLTLADPQSYVDVGALVFLLAITPLGLEEVPNVVLAAGLAFLLTQEFPADLWTMLRRRRLRTLTDSAGADVEQPDLIRRWPLVCSDRDLRRFCSARGWWSVKRDEVRRPLPDPTRRPRGGSR